MSTFFPHKSGIIVILSLLGFVEIAAQIGCTDPLANNYNNTATQNDGSCTYNNTIVSATDSYPLDITISETSGLIFWNGKLYTHNDNSDTNLYEIDPSTGTISNSVPLTSQTNVDWEEIAQDADYIYIGDFGNNVNGNRTDLKILRVSKTSIIAGVPQIDIINFAYEDQMDFTPQGANNTDYDCEAFIISTDSIFLFTKEWISGKTRIYKLPKAPGTYQAELQDTFDIDGLVTGAAFEKDEGIIALSGYNSILQPFVFLLYDFSGEAFFSGNKRKLNLNLPFHQVEGITTEDGLNFFITNERFNTTGTTQKLHTLNLTQFLDQQLNIPTAEFDQFKIYPNPASSYIEIFNTQNNYPLNFTIVDTTARTVMSGKLENKNSKISISELAVGTYILHIGEKLMQSFRVIKK